MQETKSGPMSMSTVAAPGEMPVGTETILAVEDEPAVREIVATTLAGLGYTMLQAENGVEALEIADQYADGEIGILITDMMMPVMGGWELVQRLSETHPCMRVLFISGYANSEGFRGEVRQARVEFLPKPFMPSQLAQKVRAILDE